MNSYGFLAGCYDEFTTDVDYAAWAEYIQRHFERAGLPGSTVLDLACGTGSLTRELSLRGYEMIGVDLSPTCWPRPQKRTGMRRDRPHFSVPEHGSAGSVRHHRRLRLLPGQRELCHRPQKAAAGLSAGPPLPHARRAVPL